MVHVSHGPYDALVLVSFGGPEGPDDVVPFLENVTRGRGVPPERLAEVGEHYLGFGGTSPINEQNRRLLAALRRELDARHLGLPVYWGNRNWAPYLVDALRHAHEDGARRVLALVTSAYASYSGCRQYREDVAAALLQLAAEGRTMDVDKLRHYFNHPGFVAANADAVTDAVERLRGRVDGDPHIVFVTHSLPVVMAPTAGPAGGAYVAQHVDVARQVCTEVRARTGRELPWSLAYCSRSGPARQAWLEPDVKDHMASLAARGVPGVVVAPVGFVSDHMEVVYDLDTEAAATAGRLGLGFERAATAGTAPAFVTGLVDLVAERARAGVAAGSGTTGPRRPAGGTLGPSHDVCPRGCCPNLLADRPAACGADWVQPAPAS
jgi:ferrochelatase